MSSLPTLEWKLSRNGKRVPIVNGRAVASLYDPAREAERQTRGILEEMGDARGQVLLLVGIGGPEFLGHLQILADAGVSLFIYEPLSELLNDCMAGHTSGSVQCTDQWIRAKEWAQLATLVLGHRGTIVASSFHQHAYESLLGIQSRIQINRNTLSRFARLWTRNLYLNAENWKGQAIQELRGKHKGRCAIILGAGPSLSDHMESLARLRKKPNRPVLIAVDTAYSVCCSHNILPDFVLTVDPQPVNFYHLAGHSNSTSLVADPSASPLALRRWSGPIYYTGNPFPLFASLWKALFSNPTMPDELAYGGSVSTNAYDFAQYLGCVSVLLVGQDLSFTGSRVHASGSALEERLQYIESRTMSRETANYRQRFAIPVVPLPGEKGSAVHSNDKLKVFFDWFNRRFQEDKDKLEIGIARSGGAEFSEVPLYSTIDDWLGVQESKGRISERTSKETSLHSDHHSRGPSEQMQDAIENLQTLADDIQALQSLLADLSQNPSLANDSAALSAVLNHASTLRTIGTSFQREILALERGSEISEEFWKKAEQEAFNHRRQIAKLRTRLEQELSLGFD